MSLRKNAITASMMKRSSRRACCAVASAPDDKNAAGRANRYERAQARRDVGALLNAFTFGFGKARDLMQGR